MNFSMIVYILAWVLRIEGISLLLPFICAILYKEYNTAAAILAVSAVSLVVGVLLTQKKPKKIAFYAREGFVIVAGCWLVLSLVGALPFYISGKIPHYIDAVFEIVSGFTTTGSSILSDVEALGKGLIFWRSFSHWMGGMGVLVLVLTVLPLGGGYNMMIMKAESPGPDVSKMVPRVADTAKALYKIYFVLTVICIIAFLVSGMPLFDALCIGFGTAGTGGFAIRNSGMADYSMLSQFLITIFMILFGINFNVYYLLQRRKWKDAFSSEEARTYLLIILCSTLFISFNNLKEMGNGLLFALHHAFFTVGSIITTTGFSTLDYNHWAVPSQMVILFLMISGACAGSTGGGIKVSRLIILLKNMGKELQSLDYNVVRSVSTYLIAYCFVYIISIFLISFDGFDFTTNFSAISATFNNIGPGLAKVGPIENFSIYSPFSKAVMIFDMLAGRLEIFPMLILFSPKTWKRTN